MDPGLFHCRAAEVVADDLLALVPHHPARVQVVGPHEVVVLHQVPEVFPLGPVEPDRLDQHTDAEDDHPDAQKECCSHCCPFL